MSRIKLYISILISIIVLPSAVSATKVTARIDSAYLMMGKQTSIHVETVLPVSGNKEVRILIPPADTLVKNIEVSSVELADSSVVSETLTLLHNITIQSFDSGLYTIPPVKVIAGHDTMLSNHLVLKVLPAQVDSLKGKIHDYADVEEPPHHFLDFLSPKAYRIFIWLLIAAIVIAAGYFGWRWFTKRKEVSATPAKPIPPYEEAVAALEKLRAEKLCEKGYEREYYTRLTDILRVYLLRRFDIKALEMTSTQILRSLSERNETKLTRRQMEEILTMADFVKFAKMRPLPDDNRRTFNQAMEFIESTKPIPEPESEQEPSTNQTDK